MVLVRGLFRHLTTFNLLPPNVVPAAGWHEVELHQIAVAMPRYMNMNMYIVSVRWSLADCICGNIALVSAGVGLHVGNLRLLF